MRVGRPLTLLAGGREYRISGEPLTETEIVRTLEKATGASLHAAAAAMSRGYINYQGLRIGICGTAVIQNGEVKGFRSFSSLAVRIPHECRGICDGIIREMYAAKFENTLILSPPGGGKTTALRELIRKLSNSGYRVGVVDERGELAACSGQRAQFDVGTSSDVLTGCPKAAGAMMLLRGMNPQIIAMDEITQSEDLGAIQEICGCGVGLLASAHASGVDELEKRPLYRRLVEMGVFYYAVLIHGTGKERCYEVRRLRA